MKYSEQLNEIASALNKAQAEIKNPVKNLVNKGVQGAPKYANLSDTLSEYVLPIITKYGLSIFQSVKSDEAGRVGVSTTIFHSSGQFIEGDYAFCLVKIPKNKDGKEILTEGQATGICITYLRRYSLNAALGINGDDDTDGSFTDTPLNSEPLTYETALEYVLPFGKNKGKTLKDLYKEDQKYIKWLKENESTDATIKEAIQIIESRIAEFNAEKKKGKAE